MWKERLQEEKGGWGEKEWGRKKGDNERGEGERRGIVKKEKNVKGEQEGTMRER